MESIEFLTYEDIQHLFVGESVYFGKLPQDYYDPLVMEWVVSKRDGNQLTLISKYLVDVASFDGKSWADSEIRRKLNGVLFDSMFSEEQKQLILCVPHDYAVFHYSFERYDYHTTVPLD